MKGNLIPKNKNGNRRIKGLALYREGDILYNGIDGKRDLIYGLRKQEHTIACEMYFYQKAIDDKHLEFFASMLRMYFITVLRNFIHLLYLFFFLIKLLNI